jgi:transposase-like protein
MTKHSPIRYFKASPEIIRLAVMMYVRFPLSLGNVEDLMHERDIDGTCDWPLRAKSHPPRWLMDHYLG